MPSMIWNFINVLVDSVSTYYLKGGKEKKKRNESEKETTRNPIVPCKRPNNLFDLIDFFFLFSSCMEVM